MNFLDNFTEIIEDYLILEEIDAKTFAKQAGLPQSNVSAWLTGKCAPNLDSFTRIADFFDCSFDYLAGRAEKKEYIPAVEHRSFAERLDFLIEKNKVTSNRISRICTFKNSNFPKWRQGRKPKPETLIALADYFNVSLDYLVGRSDCI